MRNLKKAATTIVLLVVLAVTAAADWKSAKPEYDKYMKRESLQMHVRGYKAIAASGDAQAFTVFRKDYKSPPAPIDHHQYCMVQAAFSGLHNAEYASHWQNWRKTNKKSTDAWLWYHALRHQTSYRGPEAALSEAATNEDAFLRAVSCIALSRKGKHAELLTHWGTAFPKKSKLKKMSTIEKAVILETAFANWAAAAPKHIGTEPWKELGRKLIPYIEDKKIEDRTRWVLERLLMRAFGFNFMMKNKKAWLEYLEVAVKVLDSVDSVDSQYATFIGIKATGDKIVYCIDMSDSMLEPLTKEQQGVITGENKRKKKPDADKKKRKKKHENEVLEEDIDWSKVKNRFDAARAYLIQSLLTLRTEQEYAVVFFGSSAAFMDSTPTLMKATVEARKKTIAELKAITPGEKKANRPYGTLRGNTNLHGAIRRAFKVTTKEVVGDYEYVNESAHLDGTETIFILSDGDPTMDDFAKNDPVDPSDNAGDPERPGETTKKPILYFPGPYGYKYQRKYLPEDVRRLNLFRYCEIHCIGIGEVSKSLLLEIAKAGDGQVKIIGRDKE